MDAVRPVRLVLVDDHPMFREGLRRLLEVSAGFKVVGEAGDGQQGLDLCMALRPDIVLLDVEMPRLTGLEVLARLRDVSSGVAAILLTAEISRRDILEAVMLGARGVLLKTVDGDALLKCLREVALGGYWLEHGTIDGLVARLRGDEGDDQRDVPAAGASHLTPREREVVAAVVSGASNADIGREMGVSSQTVKNHLSRIFDKLGVGTRLELAVYGLHHGLAADEPRPEAVGRAPHAGRVFSGAV